MLDKLGGRKAAAFLTGLIVSVAVFLIKGDLSNNLADMIKFLVASYMAGNVGADIASSVVAAKTEQAAPIMVGPSVESQAIVDGIASTQAELQQSVAATQQSINALLETQSVVTQALAHCQNGVAYLVQRAPAPQQQQAYAEHQPPQQQQQSRQPGNPFGI